METAWINTLPSLDLRSSGTSATRHSKKGFWQKPSRSSSDNKDDPDNLSKYKHFIIPLQVILVQVSLSNVTLQATALMKPLICKRLHERVVENIYLQSSIRNRNVATVIFSQVALEKKICINYFDVKTSEKMLKGCREK